MIFNWKLVGFVAFLSHLSFLQISCPTYDRFEITYEVTEKLDGKILLQFFGFTYAEFLSDSLSKEERLEKRKMEKFYAGDYKEEAEDMIELFSIINPKIEILEKSETKCTVLLTGTFENLVRSLTSLTESEDFTFRKEGDRLTIILGSCKDEDSKDRWVGDFTFSFKYAGDITMAM